MDYEQIGKEWLAGKIIFKEFNGLKLNAKQIEALNSKDREILTCGGFASGKTTAWGIKLWLFSMMFPGNRILLGRKTLSDIENATIPDLMDIFPEGTYTIRRVSNRPLIEFPNGSQIICMGLDTMSGQDEQTKKSIQKIKSLNLGGVWIDQLEEVEYSIYEALSGRLRRNSIPIRQINCTTNPANFWAYDYFKENPRDNTKLIMTSMFDNAVNLPQDYLDDQKKKGELYYRRYVLGEWTPDTLVEGTVFAEEHINRLKAQVRAPIRESGGIKIFEEPARQIYQIGIDPSLGEVDPCHIKVISVDTGREVACYSGFVPTVQIANKAITLANMYNQLKDPLIIPESTGAGQALIEELRKRYDKIFIREVYSDRQKTKTKKLGFQTGFSTKMQLIEHFKKLLENNFPTIRDGKTFKEFQTFIYSDDAEKKGAGAQKGYHDDGVMATLLAYWGIAGEEHKEENKSLIQEELKKINKVHKRFIRRRSHCR